MGSTPCLGASSEASTCSAGSSRWRRTRRTGLSTTCGCSTPSCSPTPSRTSSARWRRRRRARRTRRRTPRRRPTRSARRTVRRGTRRRRRRWRRCVKASASTLHRSTSTPPRAAAPRQRSTPRRPLARRRWRRRPWRTSSPTRRSSSAQRAALATSPAGERRDALRGSERGSAACVYALGNGKMVLGGGASFGSLESRRGCGGACSSAAPVGPARCVGGRGDFAHVRSPSPPHTAVAHSSTGSDGSGECARRV
mmetsp:Transcript_55490/g.147235  ORF Transcript_55490/g.147235 Transcript_55490/m.147235 type:complete len:253 (+) Transcript_55490:480-1238(+)